MATCTRCLRDASTGPCTDPLCPLVEVPVARTLTDDAIGRRLGSSGMEYLAVLVGEILTGSLVGMFSVVPVIGTLLGAVIGGVFSLLAATYWIIKDTGGGRRSVGKRVGRMQVVDVATGAPASAFQAALRNSYYIVACLLGVIPGVEVVGWAMFGLAALMDSALILSDGAGRRLGDRMAGTQVVPKISE